VPGSVLPSHPIGSSAKAMGYTAALIGCFEARRTLAREISTPTRPKYPKDIDAYPKGMRRPIEPDVPEGVPAVPERCPRVPRGELVYPIEHRVPPEVSDVPQRYRRTRAVLRVPRPCRSAASPFD
jgi:hypothetical protein